MKKKPSSGSDIRNNPSGNPSGNLPEPSGTSSERKCPTPEVVFLPENLPERFRNLPEHRAAGKPMLFFILLLFCFLGFGVPGLCPRRTPFYPAS